MLHAAPRLKWSGRMESLDAMVCNSDNTTSGRHALRASCGHYGESLCLILTSFTKNSKVNSNPSIHIFCPISGIQISMTHEFSEIYYVYNIFELLDNWSYQNKNSGRHFWMKCRKIYHSANWADVHQHEDRKPLIYNKTCSQFAVSKWHSNSEHFTEKKLPKISQIFDKIFFHARSMRFFHSLFRLSYWILLRIVRWNPETS